MEQPNTPPNNRPHRLWLQVLIWGVVLGLVGWTLTQVPLAEAWGALQRLTLPQVILLLVVNALMLLMFSARWWVLLETLGHRLPYFALSMHRLAGFSVSYFTPGPQVGGEPLLVILLRKHHRVPLVTAATSIGVDLLIEIAINMSILVAGLIVALRSIVLGGLTSPSAVVLFVVLALLPIAYIVALLMGKHPLSALLGWLPKRLQEQAAFEGVFEATRESENQAADVFRGKPGAVLIAVIVSLVSWLAIAGEYWLVLRFVGLTLTPVELIILLLVTRIAFLAPLPSGLGALEASQVLAFEALGFEPAAAITASLIIRGRDILFGLVGLWWAGLEWAKYERE